MDKNIEISNLSSHQINILERKNISLSGIKKIISFDHEEFLMESVLGTILLKGEELEIIKLDTHDGNVVIKGIINSFSYIESKSRERESFITKLFK